MGALLVWASSTSRMIWESTMSWPTRVARKTRKPRWFRVAPQTSAPGLLGHGQALAGEHGFIHAELALDHDRRPPGSFRRGAPPPGRPTITCCQGNFHVPGLVPAHPGGGRGQGEEAADGLRGPAPGAGLQPAAQEDEGDDHHGGVEVDRRGVAGRGHGVGKEGDPGGVDQ